MTFAPGMHAFPGGQLADVDTLVDEPLRACAIRETSEEVAINVRDCVLFDRWITPEVEDRRYDVSFFIADVEQRGRLTTTEADSMLWITPSDALTRHHQGALPMLRPTRAVLEDLAAGRVIDDPRAVVPKLPRARPDGLWDVIDAETDRVLATVDVGPILSETDGRIMEV